MFTCSIEKYLGRKSEQQEESLNDLYVDRNVVSQSKQASLRMG